MSKTPTLMTRTTHIGRRDSLIWGLLADEWGR